MSKLRAFTIRYPVIFAFILTLLFQALLRATALLYTIVPKTNLAYGILEIVNIIWPVALALIFGYVFIIKEKSFKKTLKTGLLMFIIFGIMLFTVVASFALDPATPWLSPSGIIIGIISLIGIGIREEFIFRGIMTNALFLKHGHTSKGLWLTVLVSSLLFGFGHMFNMTTGVTFISGLVQSINAFALGLLFAAIYLRGGNIWCAVLLHAIIDASGLFQSTFINNAITSTNEINSMSLPGFGSLGELYSLISIPAMIIVGLFLLRKSKHAEIFTRLESLRSKLGIK